MDRVLVFAAVLISATACAPAPTRPAGLRPNVLVVVSDTLRRDHLPIYGYGREVSPHLQAFARTGTVFERAYAQSPSTKPSIASLFTSRYPHQHGAIYNEHALADDFVTLAEVFRDEGYATAAFTENPMIGREFGYDQGFGTYETHAKRHGKGSGRADEFDRAVETWLDDACQSECLLYVHYIDPHSPYAPPAEYRGRFDAAPSALEEDFQELRVDSPAPRNAARAIARYDEEILYVDERFGRLLARLEARGLRSNTIVVFVSDHGEAFGEHGHWHHSKSVHSELIDIPLIISFPEKLAPGIRSEPVQHVDLFPTLLDLAGIERDGLALEGSSLLTTAPDILRDRAILSEHLRSGWGERQRALISGHWKLVEDLDTGLRELYRLSDDGPPIRESLAGTSDETLLPLTSAMDRLRTVEDRPTLAVEIAPETESALKTLGYITGPGASPPASPARDLPGS